MRNGLAVQNCVGHVAHTTTTQQQRTGKLRKVHNRTYLSAFDSRESSCRKHKCHCRKWTGHPWSRYLRGSMQNYCPQMFILKRSYSTTLLFLTFIVNTLSAFIRTQFSHCPQMALLSLLHTLSSVLAWKCELCVRTRRWVL